MSTCEYPCLLCHCTFSHITSVLCLQLLLRRALVKLGLLGRECLDYPLPLLPKDPDDIPEWSRAMANDVALGSRPGILVLINDADWELEGEEAYEIQSGDNILFVSTLHGG